jgi:transcriptional regulator GlxA family with amidase domain
MTMMTRLIFPFILCTLLACNSNQGSSAISSSVNLRDSLANIQLGENAYNVALLIMDGTFNTELTAPMDIFHHTKFRENIKPMNVFTIANTLNPIRTFEGLTILPDFDYMSNYPDIDILVIPAAEHNLDSDLQDEALLKFIQAVSKNALYVTSHCDGAFVLAKTGLIDDRVSTTFPGDVAAYKVMYPRLDIREDAVFVHDGKFITSAGGAKSFESSLYLCELLYGKKVADELAKGMVIDWDLTTIPFVLVE